MRIHHVAPETEGIVWQITGGGVRRVLIRRKPIGTIFAVSRFVFSDAARVIGGFAPKTVHAPITDLFPTEHDARVEFCRRRRETHSALDRRCLRTRQDGEVTPVEAVLAGFAVGLTFLMVWI